MNGIKNLQKTLSKKNLGGVLTSNFYNILYLTGFKTLAPEEREAFVLLTKNSVYLFTDARYLTKSKNGFLLRLIEPHKRLSQHLEEITKKEKIQRLGFEAEDLKFHEYEAFRKNLKNITLVPTQKIILKTREIKEQEEIKKIRKACEISSRSLQEIVKTINIGQTEKEIAFKLEFWLKEKGYEPAFDPIVAVDGNAAIPHYNVKTGQGKLKKGSVLLIDFGAKYKDYCSDMTRVFFIGRPTDEILNIYKKLLSVQEKTIQEIKKTKELKKIDLFCRKLLTDEQLPNYGHSTGHGVGLEVHENPRISPTSKDERLENQIFTIEPGVYSAGKFGMRIEDTVLVKNGDKPVILTKFTKQPFFLR